MIGKEIINKKNGLKVKILSYDKKNLYVDAGFESPVPISYQECLNNYEIDSELKNEIETHVFCAQQLSLFEPLKINRQITEENPYKKNLAFKMNYCDGGREENGIGFAGVCSKRIMQYNENTHSANNWCNMGPCPRCARGEVTIEEMLNDPNDEFVCYETEALVKWRGLAGTDTVDPQQKPRRICQGDVGNIGVFVTQFPYTKRWCIFGIFYISKLFRGNDFEAGYAEAHPKYRIAFTEEEARSFNFFNYYHNPKHPESTLWGTGLLRYPLDDEMLEILKAAVEIKTGTKDEALTKELLDIFCKERGIVL